MKISVFLSAIVLTLWLFLGSFWYAHHHHPKDGVAFPNVSLSAPADHWKLNAPFIYAKGKSSLQLLQRTQNAISDIQLYLRTHPQRQLVITGLGSPDEIGSQKALGLGLARARSVAKHLNRTQLKPGQIVTKGAIEMHPIQFNEQFVCGVHLSIKGQAVANPVHYEVEETILDLNFDQFPESPDQSIMLEEWMKQAQLALLQSEDRRIVIQSMGGDLNTPHDNLQQARKKALDLKKRMVDIGLEKDRIILRVDQNTKSASKIRLNIIE